MNADEALAAENRSHGSNPGPDSQALDTALAYLQSALLPMDLDYRETCLMNG